MKVLFTTNPLLGHFLPMVPLIRAVRAAGHQVRVATGADLAPAVHRHGFPLWAVGPNWAQTWAEYDASADPAADAFERRRHAATVLFAESGVARARQLMPMARAWRPDVVVHELLETAGWEAAAASGAVNVIHGLGTYERYLPELASVACRVAAEALGTPDRSRTLLDAPYLDPCPPALQEPGVVPFRRSLPIRPEVGAVYPGERLPDAMRHLPYERTIYLTLGTVFNTPDAWSTALEAVRDLPVNVIGTTGSELDPAVFGRQPAHVALTRFVPQALVMRHVDAVVCHAGSGTMLGALAAGRPLVALPLGADQFVNAEQIVRSGVGVAVRPAERTPETVRAAIIQVLSGLGFAQAAYAVQTEIAAMPSPERRTADLATLVEEAELFRPGQKIA